MSLFSNLLGGGGPNVGALQKKQSALIERSGKLADMLLQGYQDNVLAGAYDPNAQLDLLRRDHEYGSGVAAGNAAAAARTLGYKPGDTAPVQSIGAMGQRSTLEYDKLADQIRRSSMDAQSQALSNAVGGAAGIYGQGIGAYGDQIRTGLQQQYQQGGLFGSLVGAAVPFASQLFKKSPSTPKK